MSLLNTIKDRYSVRSYLDKEIEEDKLLQILEAGQYAPSAVNFQSWHFIVIRKKENHDKFATVYHRDWFKKAPVYIVICSDHSKSWKRAEDKKDHADIDAAITTDHMSLQATSLGLGSCWVCNFHVQKCRNFFDLPEHIEPVAILTLGYPNHEKRPVKKRNALDQIVHWETF